jgi:hypothetical protein
LDDDVKMEKTLTSKHVGVTYADTYVVAGNLLANRGLYGRKMDRRIKVPDEYTVT